MQSRQRVIVVAKQRSFDEERWKQLLIAFAYVLHERHTAQKEARPDDTPKGTPAS